VLKNEHEIAQLTPICSRGPEILLLSPMTHHPVLLQEARA